MANTKAPVRTVASVRARRQTAVELALDEERQEQYRREEALRLANNGSEPANMVVERAAAYLAFLNGESTADE